MEAAQNSSSLDSLKQIWENYETNPNQRSDTTEKMNALLSQSFQFNAQDAKELKSLVKKMQGDDNLKELSDKIQNLAEILETEEYSVPLWETMDIWTKILSFTPVSQRHGIHLTNSHLAALARNPSYLMNISLSLNQLNKLLDIYGPGIEGLDLSKVLSEDDRKALDTNSLRGILAKCPKLETLTLYNCNRIHYAPGKMIKSLVIVATEISLCTPNRSPHIEIHMGNSEIICLCLEKEIQLKDLNSIFASGMSEDEFNDLPLKTKIQILQRGVLYVHLLDLRMSLAEISRYSDEELKIWIDRQIENVKPSSDYLASPLANLKASGMDTEEFRALEFSKQLFVLCNYGRICKCLENGLPGLEANLINEGYYSTKGERWREKFF